jgi:hypothetical protein
VSGLTSPGSTASGARIVPAAVIPDPAVRVSLPMPRNIGCRNGWTLDVFAWVPEILHPIPGAAAGIPNVVGEGGGGEISGCGTGGAAGTAIDGVGGGYAGIWAGAISMVEAPSLSDNGAFARVRALIVSAATRRSEFRASSCSSMPRAPRILARLQCRNRRKREIIPKQSSSAGRPLYSAAPFQRGHIRSQQRITKYAKHHDQTHVLTASACE